MKKVIVLIMLATFLQVGCSQITQNAKLTLYNTNVSPDVTELPNVNYVGDVSVGPEGKIVPVRVSWSVGQDDTKCLRIANLKVERMGGEPSLVISDVKHTTLPKCVMKWNSSDTTKYQVASISLRYETRKGLKQYSFSGTIATIHGNGEFIP